MTHQPTAAADIAITNVSINTDALATLALKYPAGLLMIALPSHLELIREAARDAHIQIFIVNNGKKLLVYHTDDGELSSVPTSEPLFFFETFQRLQIESMQRKHEHAGSNADAI